MNRNRFKSASTVKIDSNPRVNRNLLKSPNEPKSIQINIGRANQVKMQITRNELKLTVVSETMLIASSSIDEKYWNKLSSERSIELPEN